jgi:Fur family ferric uptake transcriptional regulator
MKTDTTLPVISADPALQELTLRLLHGASVRPTEARIRVLSIMLASSRALSHQELQTACPDMDRVTLYRGLDCLTEHGLIHKILSDDRIFRYSASHEFDQHGVSLQIQHQHAHFKCTQCSRIFCLSEISNLEDSQSGLNLSKQLRATLEATRKQGFQNQDIELTIKGRCADCIQHIKE